MLYINSILYIYSNQVWQTDLFSYSKLRTYETTSLKIISKIKKEFNLNGLFS